MMSFSFIHIFIMLCSEIFLDQSLNETKTFQLVKENVKVQETKYAKKIIYLSHVTDKMNVFILFVHLLHHGTTI